MEENETKEQVKENKGKALLKKLDATRRGFFHDFKAFISKGNVVQLAVAFIMGAAFTAIVNSLVGDIFMPLFGLIFGKTDIAALSWVVSPELTIFYGKFILAVVNFLLVSFVLFLIIKAIATAESGIKKLKKGQIVEKPPVPLTKTEQLLTEIKELLTKQDERG